MGKIRRFTPDEDHSIISMVGDGYTYRAIAERLKRDKGSIVQRAQSLNARKKDAQTALSPYSLARRVFPDRTTMRSHIQEWIERGWLRAKRVRNKVKGVGKTGWKVEMDDLYAFLECPDYFFAWTPDDITNRDLREWAQETRDNAPWQWLTIPQAAKQLNYEFASVYAWILMERLPAVKYRTQYFVRSDMLSIPDERPRNHKLKESVDEIRRLYRVEKRTQTSLAMEYGVSQVAISKIIRGETYREESEREGLSTAYDDGTFHANY